MEMYNTVHKLGSGACGAVYLVRQKRTDRLFALKKIQLDENRRNRTKTAVLKEAKILAELKHPNIVAYHDSFFDESEEYLCIVQDYCDGGTLDDKIQDTARKKEHFAEKQIIRWFIQLTMAVQYMHCKKILHRDLKTQNVFMNKSGTTCKLGDFGISKMMEATIDLASTCVGTPCYLAPEMCQDIPYSSKADVWALGCLLYEMCSLRPAFEAHNLISLFYKIIKADVEPLPKQYSEGLTQVVNTVLAKSPEDRPSARQLLTVSYVKEHLAEFIAELMTANEMRETPEKSDKSRGAMSCRNEGRAQQAIHNRSKSVESSPSMQRRRMDINWEERQRLSQTMDSAIKLNIPQTDKTPRRLPTGPSPRKEKHVCELCGRTFSMPHFLTKHMKRTHEGAVVGESGDFTPSKCAPTPSEPEVVQYEDDFESDNEQDDYKDYKGYKDRDTDEIEEELSQGSGQDTDDEYADDFEDYDSDDDLDGMVFHAKEFQDDDFSDEDELVLDDEPSSFLNSYKGLLQEHAIARLGKRKYTELTQGKPLHNITEEDLRMSVVRKSDDDHVETCFLVELLNDQPS